MITDLNNTTNRAFEEDELNVSHRYLVNMGGDAENLLRETAHLGVRRNEDLILPLKLEIDEPSRSSRSHLTNLKHDKKRKSRASHATGEGSQSGKRANTTKRSKPSKGLLALKKHKNKALGRTIIGESSVERSKMFATSRLSKHSLNSASRLSNTKSGRAGRSEVAKSQRKAIGSTNLKVNAWNQYAHSIMLPQTKSSMTISETRLRGKKVPSNSRPVSRSIKKSTYSSRDIIYSNPMPAYMLREDMTNRSSAVQ